MRTEPTDLPEPPDVKPIVAALWRDPHALEPGIARLEAKWGPVDYRGPDVPFDATTYYEREMGAPLLRTILAFRDLRPSEWIVAAKHDATRIEDELRRADGGRSVNLDPGYLDADKVVLASWKRSSQKIHLGRRVWADLICRFEKGKVRTFDWTFPDFASGRYDEVLLTLRAAYLPELAEGRSTRRDDRGA